MNTRLFDFLKSFITSHKLHLFEKNIANRTRYIAVLLEDIYQPHNASAVLRTCDGFGIQDIHIIENKNKYRINPDVTLGSDKWLSIFRYNRLKNNTTEAIHHLKSKGYRIIAATPHNKEKVLDTFDISRGKAVVCLGAEMRGLSEELLEAADEYLTIPMSGFIESFNISVSAAIILHYLTLKLRNSGIRWELSTEEKLDIMIEWMKRTIPKSDLLVNEFLKRNSGITNF